MSGSINSIFCITCCLCLLHIVSKTDALDPYGCEDNWFNFNEHCYKVVLNETTFEGARSECLMENSELASVWSESEKKFLVSQWQFPRHLLGFLWVGLKGTASDDWLFSDLSSSDSGWSVLDGAVGSPSSTDNKCVTLKPSATVAFFDCSMLASAYVCKKALPKIYITPGFVNRTELPVAVSPLTHTQTFQRMYPPRLTSFPGIGDSLAELTVDDEVGCAYKCFSITSCMIFQVSCHTQTRCTSYRCILFPHVDGFL